MVDAESSREKPLEGQKTSLERVSSNSNSLEGPRSESAVFEESTGASTTPIIPFAAPNGGLKAWSAVLGGFLCQFASFGFLNV